MGGGGRGEPGTELGYRRVTPPVGLPLMRFTSEFGMGSAWFHIAMGTRTEVIILKAA